MEEEKSKKEVSHLFKTNINLIEEKILQIVNLY